MKVKTIITSMLMAGLLSGTSFAQQWGADNWSGQFVGPPLHNPVNNPLNQFNTNAFNQWCDRFDVNIRQQAALADRLLVSRRFGQAVKVVRHTLNHSGVATYFPPVSYRPYVYQLLARTSILLNQFGLQLYTDAQLDSADTNPGAIMGQAQNLALLATVGVGQLRMIASMDEGYEEMLDQQILQYRHGRHCDQCETNIQNRLQELAVKELRAFQNYATMTQNGNTYPIVDTPTYFKLLSNIAIWAATDLQFNAFPAAFSCPIHDLYNLPVMANQLLGLEGHKASFRKINWYLNQIIRNLDQSNRCDSYQIPYHDYSDGNGDGYGY